MIDNREKEGKHEHITKYFDDNKIPYEYGTLNYGDYTIKIPKQDVLQQDILLNNVVVIERKADLNELASNFVSDRKRILLEFYRTKGKIFLAIEKNSLSDIEKHNYKSNLNVKSFKGLLYAMQPRFNLSLHFITDKNEMGEFIYTNLYYYAREYLKDE